ncbi:MAG: cupin domain-containing protein [Synechococcales bacterium]|nr:cupin domain-containing protein [Synechococcales bacterium]
MENDDRSELIALAALGLLEDGSEEANSVRVMLAEMPEQEQELAALQQVVSNLVYTVPPLAIAPDVKTRLFDRLFSPPPAVPTSKLSLVELTALKQKMETVAEWQPTLPQVETGTIDINLEKREIICFVRVDGQVRFPKHRHASNEEIVVLEGDLILDGQVYGSGDRICSLAGTAHLPETQTGCLLYLRTSLDDQALLEETTIEEITTEETTIEEIAIEPLPSGTNTPSLVKSSDPV